MREQQVRAVGPDRGGRGRELLAKLLDRQRLRNGVNRDPGQFGGHRLHAPGERDTGEHPLQRVVRRAGSADAGRVVVAADRGASQAGVGETLEPAEHVREGPIGRPRVIEDVSEPQEAVGFLPDRLVHRPGERAEEVLLAEVPALVVPQVREVRTPEVGVPERDEPAHRRVRVPRVTPRTPALRPRAAAATARDPVPTSGTPRRGRPSPAGRTANPGSSRSPRPA